MAASNIGLAQTSSTPTIVSPKERVYVQRIQTKSYQIELKSLNKHINKWFILSIAGNQNFSFHLHNRNNNTILSLTNSGILFSKKNQEDHEYSCQLWDKRSINKLRLKIKVSSGYYLPLCKGRLYVRLKKPSNTQQSLTESTTKLLRKTQIGESVINSIKPHMVDIMSEEPNTEQPEIGLVPQSQQIDLNVPLSPFMVTNSDIKHDNEHSIGIKLDSDQPTIEYGKWYKSNMHEGIYISLFRPDLIDPGVLELDGKKINPISEEEKSRRVYIAAYNLELYAPEYVVGTEEPHITNPTLKDHIVPIGSIPPYEIEQSVGVFIGGFKTRHNTINYGPNKGKTYGFIEKGVELASMSGGLATAYLKIDGRFEVDKWPEEKNSQEKLKREVIAARQNGVLLIDNYQVGKYVNNWGQGNWSGSAEGSLKTMRSGICIQEKEQKRFLLFMAFISASPSTMAQTMRAFSCKFAMHLDMNAYMYMHNAIYSYQPEKGYQVEYLNQHMKYPSNIKRHRYIMDNNSRDFFYIKRR